MKIPLAVKERINLYFPGSSIFLTGCSADGCRREYCEFNLAAYPAKGMSRLIEHEKEIYYVEPIADLKYILAFPHSVVADPDWNLARILSPSSRQKVAKSKRLYMREVEVNSTSHLLNSFALLEKGKIKVSTLYFVSAIAGLSELFLLRKGIVPHPSHVASQLRENSLLYSFADAASFDLASSTNAERRMLKVVSAFDPIKGRVIRRKMQGMIKQGRLFDSLYYSYWAVSTLLAKNRESATPLAEMLNLSSEETHLRHHLKVLSDILKSYIKQSV